MLAGYSRFGSIIVPLCLLPLALAGSFRCQRQHRGQHRARCDTSSGWTWTRFFPFDRCGYPLLFRSSLFCLPHHSPSPLRAASMAAYTSSASSSLTFVAGM